MRKIIILLLCALVLTGCASASGSETVTTEMETTIYETELESSTETESEISESITELESDNSSSNAYDALKELVIENGSKIECTDEMTETAYNTIIESRSYIAHLDRESVTENELFNFYLTLSGYLMNYYDLSTEYGRVGQMGYVLATSVLMNISALTNNAVDDLASYETKADNSTNAAPDESIILTPGNYVAGDDIPTGKYNVMGLSFGNFVAYDSSGKLTVNEIIREDEMVYRNLQLEEGSTVEISNGGKVELQLK